MVFFLKKGVEKGGVDNRETIKERSSI